MGTNDARATGSALSTDVADRVAARLAAAAPRETPAGGRGRRLLPAALGSAARIDATGGSAFLTSAVDDVLRPEGVGSAAAGLQRLAADIPADLPWLVRGVLQVGGAVAPVLPAPVVSVARRGLRDLVARRTLDARPDRLTAALAGLRDAGCTPDLRLTGAPVLGEAAARRRVDGIRALVARDDVERVSFAVSDVMAGLTPWAFDAHAERTAERLLPLFQDAAASDVRLTLVVEGRDDLDLAVTVLTRVLEEPGLSGLAAGIALPLAVPGSRDALRELGAWARVRTADGGAPLRVRLVDGIPQTGELAAAARHGWTAPFAIDRDDLDALAVATLSEAVDERTALALELELQSDDAVITALGQELADAAGLTVLAVERLTPAGSADSARSAGAPAARARTGGDASGDTADDLTADDLGDAGSRDGSRADGIPAGGFAADGRTAQSAATGSATEDLADTGSTPTRDTDAGDTDADGSADTGSAPTRDTDADGIPAAGSAAGGLDDAPRSAGPRVVLAPVVHPDDLDLVAASLFADAAPAPDEAPVSARVRRAVERSRTLILPPRLARRGTAGAHAILRDPAGDDVDDDGGLTQAVMGIAREAAAGDTSALGPDVQQMLFGGQAFVDTAVFSLRESADAASTGAAGFRNVSSTDPTVPADRAWARDALAAADTSTAGDAVAAAGRVDDTAGLDDVLARVRAAAQPWGALAAAERAGVLQTAARVLDERRAAFLEVLASEAGVLVAEADAEVDQAVDAAAYYAVTAKELDRVAGAVFVPDRVTVVAPRWNAPVGLCASEVLAALAAGSGVVLTPSPRARRSGAVLAEALWAAGVPRDVLAFVDLNEEASGRALVVHPGVDRMLLAGARGTAERFAAWRPELALQAVTAGRTAVIVAPSADVDETVAALVEGAFARAGQAPGASSLAILVGSAARSSRFSEQLADAVSSLRVGPASDPRSQVGPLVEEPAGAVRRALTVLESGERWLVAPRELDLDPDMAGRYWTPGVRVGVSAGALVSTEAIAAPVLGILHAPTLTRAIELQNLVGSGYVAGLHTRDADDLDLWLDTAQAGVLRVNRSTVGARAQREPLGGWGAATVGTGAMSGGPNRLVSLGSWRPTSGGPASSTLHLRGLDSRITSLIEAAQPTLGYEAFEWLRRGALSDAVVWDREFGRVKDVSRLGVERNLLRYRPADVAIRATGDAAWQALLRVLVAAVRSGSTFTLSTPVGLPAEVRHLLGDAEVAVSVESDEQWLERLAGGIPDADGDDAASITAVPRARPSRVRLVGTPGAVATLRAAVAETVAGDPAVTVYADEVTTAGRLELLPFLREQAVSIAAFRRGRIDAWSTSVI